MLHPRASVLGLLAAAALSGAPAQALDPALALTQYVHSIWRGTSFLPQDDVSSLVQTRDGYLWVGTIEGLARFDGVRSVVFDKANTKELTSNWIRALHEDREGRLWIGTFGGGVVCLEKGRFRHYGPS